MPDIFVSQPPVPPQNSPVAEPQVVVKPQIPPKTQINPLGIHSRHRFSGFRLYPEGVGFETEDKEEQIILLLRQHPIINIKWIFITLVLLTGPTLLGIFGVFAFLPMGYSLVISMVWYLVTFAYGLEGFLNWYFNVYFVTNERVIDVDFYNLISKRVSDAEIEKIQDVSYATNGVLGTILNFGDVFVQTASEVSEFKFESVPSPEKVIKILNDLMEKV